MWIKKLMIIGLIVGYLELDFGIYHLMTEKSPNHAHGLRTGIIGYIDFGEYEVDVPCVIVAWLYNYLIKVSYHPKRCFIFNICFETIATMLMSTLFRGYEWKNALAATWIGVCNIWQSAGLRIVKKIKIK